MGSCRTTQRSALLVFGLVLAVLWSLQALNAQGLLSISTSPPALPNNGQGGVMFDITCNTTSSDVNIYRLSCQTAAVATYDVEIWYRIGGMRNGTAAATTGWVLVGFAATAFQANVDTPIPLNINQVIPSGQTYGFAIAFRTGTLRYYTVAVTPTTVTNANVTVDFGGYGGAYVAAPAPGACGVTASFTPRGFVGTVSYDLAAVQGNSLQVKDITTTATGGLAVVGPNTFKVTTRNGGTTTLTNQAVTLEYSTDSGTSWPVGQSQSFTIPSLAPATDYDLNMTTAAAWTPTALGNFPIIVRINPAIGTTNSQKTVNFRPDLDITAVSTGASDPQLGNNTVQVTVKNNGTFSLNNVSIPMQYVVTGGTPALQTFTGGASLATNGGTQTFTFTNTPWNLATAGAYTVTVSMSTQLTGDPDTTDSLARAYPEAGTPGALVEYNTALNGGTTSNAFPMAAGYTSGKQQMVWSPAQLNNTAGLITHFGLQFVSIAAGNWTNVRIELGETTLGMSTLTPLTGTFDANYNVVSAPKVVVYNAALQVNATTTNFLWRVPLSTNFNYSGQNNLLVTVFVNAAAVVGNNLIYNSTLPNYRVYSMSTGDSPTGTAATGFGAGLSMRVLTQITGNALEFKEVTVNTGDVPTVGNNDVKVRVKNMGTLDYNNVPFTLQYSADNFVSHLVTQIFTPGAFAPLSEQTFTFGTQWAITVLSQQTLKARINPTTTTIFSQSGQKAYSNDLDITVVAAGATGFPAAFVPNTVNVTVRNNGNYNLNGVTIPLRYAVNGGTPILENFSGSTLNGNGTTQTFSFTQTWNPAPNNYSVVADVFPVLAGDPDTADSRSQSFVGVGLVTAELLASAVESGLSGAPAYGYIFNGDWHDIRMETIYLASELTAAGFASGSKILELQLKPFEAPPAGYDLVDMRVRMAHTSASVAPTAFTAATTLSTTNFGPTTIQAASVVAGQWLSLPLTTPFTWNGTDNVVIDFTVDNTLYISAVGGPYVRATTGPRTRLGYADSAVPYPFDTITTQINVNFVPSLRLRAGNLVSGSSLDIGSNFVRTSGQRDVYKGETVNVSVTVQNISEIGVQLNSLDLTATIASAPVPGISFGGTLPTPIILAPNAQQVIQVPMSVSPTAGGGTDVDVTVALTGGSVVSSLNPTTVPVVIRVDAAAKVFKLFDGPVPAQFLIPMTSLPVGYVSSLFFADLLATGGSGTYVWSVPTSSPAQLPASIVLSPNGSVVAPASASGTPIATDVGTRQILFSCTDGSYVTTKTLTLTIQSSPLELTQPVLVDATEGTAYTASLQATGGSASYTFSVAASSQHQLPTGLSLSPAGAITGTPQPLTQGTFNITFRVNDGFATDDATATLVVLPGPLLWVGPATMEFRETVQKSVQLLAAGGVAQRTYSVASSSAQALPTGLSVGPATGMVSGAPAASTTGTYNVTFNVSDGVTTLPYTVAITVLNALPFVIQTDVLNVGNALAPYSMQLEAEGGAEAYAWTVLSSTPALPASITLNSTTGEFSGTPAFGDAGRYALTVRCTDTALRVLDKNYTLSVLQAGGLKVELTEVSVGTTDAIEITCLGGIGDPGFVDAGGWYISVWKDGNTATSLAWSSFPTGTLLFSGAVVTINGAGTAGGAFPTFNTGTDLTLSSSSNFAVALWDRFGNIIDVVSVGNLDVTALMIATASAGITTGNWTGNVTAGFDNYSRTAPVETDSGSDWTGSGSGTVGSFNPTLALPALEFVLDGYPAAREGQAFFRQVAAAGGTPPYTYSLTAPAAPWLSINAQTGVLSGTPATADVGAFPVTVTVTDAATVSANSTETLTILGATANTQHSITLGTASGSTASGTNHAVTVTLSGAAVAVRQFEFRVALTTAELQLANIALGTPASLSNKIAVQWRRDGVNTYTIACFDLDTTPTAIANGTVLTLNFKVVPASGTNATAGTYALTVSEPVAMDAQDTLLTVAATSGSIQLSDYKAQDVNRNGQVNVVDVQLCVNIILQVTQPTYVGQGDANKSGSVNVVDVQNIVNCILTPSTCP